MSGGDNIGPPLLGLRLQRQSSLRVWKKKTDGSGLAARFPRLSIRLVRTAIEVTVLATGWLLGGSVGVGTVVYALAIGPLTQAFLPVFTVKYRLADVAAHLPDPDAPARPASVHP